MDIECFNRLQDVGRAEEILLELTTDDWTFKNLYRKHEYWETPDFEKLDECRRRLDHVHDKINVVIDLLRRDQAG